MYTDTKAKYSLGNIESDWVKLEKGVRQGCVLSPLLFSLYTEELATRIRNMDKGIKVGNSNLGILLYADDVVLIADDRDRLQEMLDVVDGYGKEFSLSFNRNKCGVLVMNETGNNIEQFRLGNLGISNVEQYNYLGVTFTKLGIGQAIKERISRANQWWGRLGSIVSFRSNKYEVVRGIWKSVAVPGLLYGMDTVRWSQENLEKMEKIQNRVGRLGLGANGMVGTEAIRGDMGWSTFEERIFKGSLKYKSRLEQMNEQRWARKVYLETASKSKYIVNCSTIANKCGFIRRWNVEENANGVVIEWKLGLDLEGEEDMGYDRNKWKKCINVKVGNFGLNKWRAGMSGKPTLSRYSLKPKPKVEQFYSGNQGSALLFKCRTNSLELNNRTHRFNELRSRRCNNCRMGMDESIEHVFFECLGYVNMRLRVLGKYKEILGESKYEEVFEGEDVLPFLFGLMESTPIEIVEATKEYLCEVWNGRKVMGDM